MHVIVDLIFAIWYTLAYYDLEKALFWVCFFLDYEVNNEKTFLLVAVDNFAMFNPKSVYVDCIRRVA